MHCPYVVAELPRKHKTCTQLALDVVNKLAIISPYCKLPRAVAHIM